MNRFLLSLSLLFHGYLGFAAEWRPETIHGCRPVWNVSESMPCGGGDVGMNVWVRNKAIFIYRVADRSDENNTLSNRGGSIKSATRPFLGCGGLPAATPVERWLCVHFRNGVEVQLWADVFRLCGTCGSEK